MFVRVNSCELGWDNMVIGSIEHLNNIFFDYDELGIYLLYNISNLQFTWDYIIVCLEIIVYLICDMVWIAIEFNLNS